MFDKQQSKVTERRTSMVRIHYNGADYWIEDHGDPEQVQQFISERLARGPFWLDVSNVHGKPIKAPRVALLISSGVPLIVVTG